GVGDIWAEPAGGGYPVFWWQLSPLPPLPSFSGGSGTFGDPYLISTPAQLNSLGYNPRLMEAHFKLTSNIDLAGVDLWMIGHYRYPFTGTFDGNDHTISNFTYNVPESYSAGIFSAIDGPNAVVKDLGIIDPDIVVFGNAGALACGLYNGTISNCYMENGNISGRYSLGGLIGIMEGGTISDCYVQGATIYGDSWRIGGLVGGVEAGTISSCYTTSSCSVSGWWNAGGLAGDVDAGATVTNCHSDSSVSGAYGYDDDCMSLGGLIGGNSGTVSNCHATGAVSGIVGAGAGGYFGGLIGNNAGTVSACYATGNISEGRFAMGGLVGSNAGCNTSYGTISDCYATGNVTGIAYLGGLAGGNGGTITNSRAEGNVTSTSTGATDWSVGGLVGHNEGIIDQSYAIGAVSGYNRVGGLAGTNAVDDMCEVIGIISDCYAMGSVSGNDKVGGLVGYQYFMSPLIPAISRCYSTGSVSGATDFGGLIGNNNNGTVTASFWDEQTSGQTTSDGGTRKTTAEMQTQTTFTDAGWDFVHIWDVCEGINYPKLIWQIPLLGDFVYPDGVNMLDLAFLAAHWLDEDCNDLNGYCEGTDLNRSGDVNFPDYGLFAQNWRKGLMPFVLDEDFETGDFSKYNWLDAGDANWVVVSDVNYEGSYSAKSGLISHNGESVLQISLIIEDGSVSFYRKVSSESDEDYLRFYIDNQLQDGWSGEQDWSLQQYAITSGIHTLKWVYMKD
ncbi:MAG: GLUG motif-containing protein, partial [Planctomycetota bacterium]